MVAFMWAGAWYPLTLGLVASAVAMGVLSIRRWLEGAAGIEFADLATAAIVGIAVALVPLVGQLVPRRGFDKFTDGARKALTLAQDEAQRFGHNWIGTEHLLLGLIREEEGTAAQALRNLRVDLEKVRIAVEFIIGRGDHAVTGEVGLTPRAKRVIELAIDDARQLGHDYIGTEHLLLGLIGERDGVAAQVLVSLGAGLKQLRAEVIRLVSTKSAKD
jgi:hypothetical protein